LWLIDIERDGPQAPESLASPLGGEIITTLSWDSTRGFHIIFVADGARLLELLAAAGAREGTGINPDHARDRGLGYCPPCRQAIPG
jgi:hypothetical protein